KAEDYVMKALEDLGLPVGNHNSGSGDDVTSGGLWTPEQGKEWQTHKDDELAHEVAREHAMLAAHPEHQLSTGEVLGQYPGARDDCGAEPAILQSPSHAAGDLAHALGLSDEGSGGSGMSGVYQAHVEANLGHVEPHVMHDASLFALH